MIKRSRRWLLLFAALFGIIAHTNAVRASLIFGRARARDADNSTTTTTASSSSSSTEETVTEIILLETSNSTKPNLTGIPQIDYIWDPNLPRELNGLDLSDYPFLVSVPPPEEIDFKCDGLHDGFYASVEWKCQLYHHCLFGIRYDFLCANFTAFDQKNFICHYVSEVDCKTSPKYFFRNNALYENPTSPPTTTTSTERTTTIATSAPISRPYNRPGRPIRRPMRRRRPQVEYYYDDEEYIDDDYEEPPPPPRRRKQRPRNRRPEYDDDERYDRRESGTRNRQDDDEYERRPAYDRPRTRKPVTEGRKYSDDAEMDRKPDTNSKDYDDVETKRKPQTNSRDFSDDDRNSKPSVKTQSNDRNYEEIDKRKPQSNSRDYDDTRSRDVEDRPASKKRYQDDDRKPNNRRSQYDDRRRTDDTFETEDRRSFTNDRRKSNNNRRNSNDDSQKRQFAKDDYDTETPRQKAKEEVIQVKPSSSSSGSSVFDRPRVAPRIRRPVPINARDKYEYTTIKIIKPQVVDDTEYYEEYEDPAPASTSLPPKQIKPEVTEPTPKVEETKRESYFKEELKSEPKSSKRPVVALTEEYDDDYVERPKITGKPNREIANKNREDERTDISKASFRANFRPKTPQSDSYKTLQTKYMKDEDVYEKSFSKEELPLYDDEEDLEPIYPTDIIAAKTDVNKKDRFSSSVERQDTPIPKIVEKSQNLREDLNGYSSKSDVRSPSRTLYDQPTERQNFDKETRANVRIVKRPFLPSRGGSPYLPRGLQPLGGNKNINEEIATIPKDKYQKIPPRSTEPPVFIEPPRNPLDVIYDSEYDVTLNDALNPTLKPLTPTRGSPIGVSLANKYERTRLQSSFDELLYAPSQIRRTAVQPPSKIEPQRKAPTVELYDDYEY